MEQDYFHPQSETANTYVSRTTVDANVLQIRLDTQKLLMEIELFLKGRRISLGQDAQGYLKETLEESGQQLANSRGIQAIMGFLSSIVNPHVVQGNYKEEKYLAECAGIRKELAYLLVVGRVDWDIKQHHLQLIASYIMNAVKPFMSRLINNKERESYGQTMKVEERNITGGTGGWNPFKR